MEQDDMVSFEAPASGSEGLLRQSTATGVEGGFKRAQTFNKCTMQYHAPSSPPIALASNTAHAVYMLQSKAGSSTVRMSMRGKLDEWPTPQNVNFTRFTFVRNPTTRLISAFFHTNMGCSSGRGKNIMQEDPTNSSSRARVLSYFEDFVRRKEEGECWDSHSMAQRGRLPDPTRYPMDFIGDLEDLSTDWEELSAYQVKKFKADLGKFEHSYRHTLEHKKLLLNGTILPANLTSRICDLFQDDYCCLKFPIPAACKIKC